MTVKNKKRIRRFFLYVAFSSAMSFLMVANAEVQTGTLSFNREFFHAWLLIGLSMFPIILGAFNSHRVAERVFDWFWHEEDPVPITNSEKHHHRYSNYKNREVKNEYR